jgi:hypothetical protein
MQMKPDFLLIDSEGVNYSKPWQVNKFCFTEPMWQLWRKLVNKFDEVRPPLIVAAKTPRLFASCLFICKHKY